MAGDLEAAAADPGTYRPGRGPAPTALATAGTPPEGHQDRARLARRRPGALAVGRPARHEGEPVSLGRTCRGRPPGSPAVARAPGAIGSLQAGRALDRVGEETITAAAGRRRLRWRAGIRH